MHITILTSNYIYNFTLCNSDMSSQDSDDPEHNSPLELYHGDVPEVSVEVIDSDGDTPEPIGQNIQEEADQATDENMDYITSSNDIGFPSSLNSIANDENALPEHAFQPTFDPAPVDEVMTESALDHFGGGEIPLISVEAPHLNSADTVDDPNTSVISAVTQFATPLKLLPPLKDIESITTPKAFSVAKDNQNSSPVVHHKSTQLEDLAEAEEDVYDATANDTFASAVEAPSESKISDLETASTFLAVDISTLQAFGPEFVSKVAHRAHQYQGVQSELSFFKLNQELINQVQHKKYDKFQKKVELLGSTNTTLTSENEALLAEVQTKDSLINDLRNQTSALSDKVFRLEAQTREENSQYANSLGAKEQEVYHLNQTINKITKSNIELGQKLSELTKELNEVTNKMFTYKLDLSKATNELSYVKNQKDWYEQELKAVQDKYTGLIKKHDSDYLRDSNRIASLSSQNESLLSLKESLQSQLKELQANFDNESSKASGLDSKLELHKIKFTRELSVKDDLVELLNVQLKERSDRIAQLEDYAQDLKESTSESIGSLQKDIAEKDDRLALLEERLRRTEDALDAELHKETELPKLAASAEMIMQTNPLGISLSSLYTEFNHMKKELILEKSQKEKLASQLQHFVAELESKKPAISNYRNQIQFYEQSIKDMLGKLESLRLDKLESDKESNRLRTRLSSYETELQSMRQLSKDLGRQLCYYLIHSKIRDGNEDPLSISERKTIDRILATSGNKDTSMETDTDQLITERLVGFANVIELQGKNEELLMAVRLFGKQLEAKEHETNGFESAAVEEAREAILTLQGELDAMAIKFDAASKERDLLKSLNGSSSGPDSSKLEVKLLSDFNGDLKNKVKEAEEALKLLLSQLAEKVKKLTEKLTEANNFKDEFQLKLSSAKHVAELAESRLENTKKILENGRKESEHIRKEADFWKEQASKQEGLLVRKSNELRDVERNLATLSASSKNLLTEKEVWSAVQKSMKDEISQLKNDKEQLNSFVFSLQSMLKERETASVEVSNKLSQSIENYQTLQQRLADKEEKILILSSQSEMALKAQNTKLEQVNELSHKLLEAKMKLSEKQNLIDTLRKKVADGQKVVTGRAPRVEHNELESLDKTVLTSEYEDLKNDLKLAELQVTEFSNIATAAEEALVNATESFDNYKATADERLTLLQNERDSLAQEVSSYKETVESIQKQMQEAEANYMSEVQDLKAKAHEFSLKANSYDDLKNDFENKFDTINNDLVSQIALNDELERKYQFKLSEVDLLNIEVAKQKENGNIMQQTVDELSNSLQTAIQELSSKEETLAEEKASKQEELDSSKIRIKDLEYQYNIALNQLELKKSGPEPDGESSDEGLREVITYLRREKESAEAKLAVMSDEKNRLKNQIESANAELNASRSQVARLQVTKIQLDDASKDHARLLEQLEQLNILRESNTTLRHENKVSSDQIAQLQLEIEELKKAVPSSVVADDTAIAVNEQELSLLKEENDRLKSQLNNNEELKQLMQRFENLKNEFKNKLMGHRTKNKELEQQLNEAKLGLEKASAQLAEAGQAGAGDSEAVASLKAQLSTAASAKLDREAKFEADFKVLKDQFESDKTALQTSLQAQFEAKLQAEVEKAKSTNGVPASDSEIRQQVEAEWKEKSAVMVKELTAKFENELESQIRTRVAEQVQTSGGTTSDESRQELTQQYEEKIKQMTEDFEKRLAEELSKVEKAVDKKYEFKLRVLNRKVEKYEMEQNRQLPTKPAEAPKVNAPLGHQFTESTLSVIRPTVEKPKFTKAAPDAKPAKEGNANGGNNAGRKRQLNNKAQNVNNKRSKE